MDSIWTDLETDIKEEVSSPLSLKSSSISHNMANSSFRNKGEVRENEKEKLLEEISVGIIRHKRNTKRSTIIQNKSTLEMSPLKAQGSCFSQFKESHSDCESYMRKKSSSLGVTDDIKFLLKEIVRSKKKKSQKPIVDESKYITMKDIVLVNRMAN